MLINCDIGERGTKHPIDDCLMQYIDIANIACGGHAGDKDSINHYCELARQYQILITAHLSYPDKINFGRNTMAIGISDLLDSLDQQYSLLPVGKIKFHGALYHQANNNPTLAKSLSAFLLKHKVNTLIVPEHSCMISLCSNIEILYEGFIERGYNYQNGKLDLVPRGQAGAVINDVPTALAQYKQLCEQNIIIEDVIYPLKVDTICIHSDSALALNLAKSIHEHR